MYKCAKKIMLLALVVIAPTLLSACGGAPEDNTSAQPSNIADRLAASSNPTSLEAPSSSAAAPASSSAISTGQGISSAQNYSRAPQASSAASSANTTPGVDVTPPSSTKLQLYRLSESSITLIWDDATDDVGISRYDIARNGEFIASVNYPSHMYVDQGLASYTNYNYTITAVDLTGNASGSSLTVSIRTLAPSGRASSMSSLSSQSTSSIPGSSADSSSSASAQTSSSPSSASAESSSSASSKTSSSLSSASAESSSSISAKSSSSLSSSSAKSSSSASSISSSSMSSASSAAQQTAKISWSHPIKRENGAFLELDEIGGYEIRYRKPTDDRYTYIVINNNRTTEYSLEDASDAEFEIAIFDKSGVYSRFVKVTR